MKYLYIAAILVYIGLSVGSWFPTVLHLVR